jgi:hypothetical protein
VVSWFSLPLQRRPLSLLQRHPPQGNGAHGDKPCEGGRQQLPHVARHPLAIGRVLRPALSKSCEDPGMFTAQTAGVARSSALAVCRAASATSLPYVSMSRTVPQTIAPDKLQTLLADQF